MAKGNKLSFKHKPTRRVECAFIRRTLNPIHGPFATLFQALQRLLATARSPQASGSGWRRSWLGAQQTLFREKKKTPGPPPVLIAWRVDGGGQDKQNSWLAGIGYRWCSLPSCPAGGCFSFLTGALNPCSNTSTGCFWRHTSPRPLQHETAPGGLRPSSSAFEMAFLRRPASTAVFCWPSSMNRHFQTKAGSGFLDHGAKNENCWQLVPCLLGGSARRWRVLLPPGVAGVRPFCRFFSR